MRPLRRMLGPLLAATLPTQVMAEDFVCRGRDPGWELVGRGGQATYGAEKAASRRSFSGSATSLSPEGVVVWRGRSGAGQPELVAVMLRGACTDPMAGEVSTYLGIVSLPSAGSVVGCCSYGGPPPTAAVAAAAPPEPSLLGEGDAEPARTPSSSPAKAAPLTVRPTPPPPPPRQIKAGSTVRIAGSTRETVNLRARPDGRVVGQLRGGRSVVVQQSAQQGGHTWYRVRGRGVPANAWIRGDLLQGG